MSESQQNKCNLAKENFADNSGSSMPTWGIILLVICFILLIISCIASIYYSSNSNGSTLFSSFALGSFINTF